MNAKVPRKKENRQFGLIMAVMIVAVFGLFFPWVLSIKTPVWPWVVSGVFAATALAVPNVLAPVETAWLRIGHVVGWINTRILLGLVYFLLFLPFGMILRLLGKDFMNRKLDKSISTYRFMRTAKFSQNNVERPF